MLGDPYRRGFVDQLISLIISVVVLAVFVNALIAVLEQYMPWIILGGIGWLVIRWLVNRNRYF